MTKRQPVDTRTIYQIKVKGHLDEHWSEWFDNLTLTYDDHDDTLLTGPVTDQSALHGLLKKVGDLGIRLISVNPVESKGHKPTEETPIRNHALRKRSPKKVT